MFEIVPLAYFLHPYFAASPGSSLRFWQGELLSAVIFLLLVSRRVILEGSDWSTIQNHAVTLFQENWKALRQKKNMSDANKEQTEKFGLRFGGFAKDDATKKEKYEFAELSYLPESLLNEPAFLLAVPLSSKHSKRLGSHCIVCWIILYVFSLTFVSLQSAARRLSAWPPACCTNTIPSPPSPKSHLPSWMYSCTMPSSWTVVSPASHIRESKRNYCFALLFCFGCCVNMSCITKPSTIHHMQAVYIQHHCRPDRTHSLLFLLWRQDWMNLCVLFTSIVSSLQMSRPASI
jgi:hypothetical protein